MWLLAAEGDAADAFLLHAICCDGMRRSRIGAIRCFDNGIGVADMCSASFVAQEAILYSYDLSTVPSVLPAFANKRDLIICDEVCCLSALVRCVFGFVQE